MYLGILAVVVVAALVRIWLLGEVPPLVTHDSADYWVIGSHLSRGKIASALAERRLPGLPLILASFLRLGASAAEVIRIQQLLGIFAAGLAAWLGWRSVRSPFGLLLGLLVGLHPAFLLFELQIMTESWSVLFLVISLALAFQALWLASQGSKATAGWIWGFAGSFAAATLIRLDNFVPLATVGAALGVQLFLLPRQQQGSLSPRRGHELLGMMVRIFLPSTLALAAWSFYLYQELGKVTLFGNYHRGRLAALAIHGKLDPERPLFASEFPGYQKEDPGGIWKHLKVRFRGKAKEGEAIAKRLVEEQALSPNQLSFRLRGHAFLAFLGLRPNANSGCAVLWYWFRSWLPAWPQASDLALRRFLKEPTSAETLRERSQPLLTFLGAYGALYLLYLRPWLVGFSLLGGALLLAMQLRARSLGNGPEGLVLAGLIGHVLGAGVHAWSLIHEDRLGAPFDGILGLVLLTLWKERGSLGTLGRRKDGLPFENSSGKVDVSRETCC
jgi:hypothetical protein